MWRKSLYFICHGLRLACFFSIASVVVAAEKNTDKYFLFVNGGYSPDSNFWVHEQDILAFKNGLFKNGQYKILSADGPHAQFAEIDGNGNFSRKPDNYVSLRPSTVGKDVGAATVENVKKAYAELAVKSPQQALIVYGDHGGQEGLALWGEKYFKPSEHFTAQNQVPTTTLLRSIYIQCFAGTMLVDQTRKVPSSPVDITAFTNQYYPPNRCGLALGRHNETGQYYTNGKNWQDSLWTQYFQRAQPPRLSDLKQHLNTDPTLTPTSVLTSDYFIEDMSEFICLQMKEKAGLVVSCATEKEPRKVIGLQEGLIRELCGECSETQKVKQLGRAVERTFNVWTSYRGFIKFFAYDFLQSKNPRYKKNVNLMGQIEYYQFEAEAAPTPKEQQAAQTKLAALQKELEPGFETEYIAAMSEISSFRNQEFNKYFDQQCNKKWLKSEMPKKILRPADYEDFISWPLAKNCRSEITQLVEHRMQTQKQYRQANIKLNEKRKALVENFLTDPRFMAVKDRYENIKQCEASAIH